VLACRYVTRNEVLELSLRLNCAIRFEYFEIAPNPGHFMGEIITVLELRSGSQSYSTSPSNYMINIYFKLL
jgi:hypothetical protein